MENIDLLLHKDVHQPLWVPLLAGGVAGTVCDITLFPLDTMKTRLQSRRTNGISFKGLYQGLGPAAVASAPSAAIFFTTYDLAKRHFPDSPIGHGEAAACGEVMACFFKVPFEVTKQRMQITSSCSSYKLLRDIYMREGLRGCYAGLGATLAREIPFGFIQMPLYEFLKRKFNSQNSSLNACVCGAVAGGVAAVATTPIDVWKTRLMLGNRDATIFGIAKQEGIGALFRGVVPRVVWISVGGSLFFGVYEQMISWVNIVLIP